MMDISDSLKLFGFSEVPDLLLLKSEYRKLVFVYHPDHGGTNAKFIALQNAYDTLSGLCKSGVKWEQEQRKNLARWRAIFISKWKDAYVQSQAQMPDDGLHFQTTIGNFKRAYIYPPVEWFYQAIFGPEPSSELMEIYRKHLLRIAPNKRMAETYAKRYWELEFSQGWVFRLPPRKELLSEY